MKFLKKIFLSMESMFVMVVIFALSIAAATFMENDFGPSASRAVVYDSLWFGILLLLLMANLLSNIVRYRLWRKEKILTLLFHASFAVILLGSAITRYAGYEGIMHIREGDLSDETASSRAYLLVRAFSDGPEVKLEKPLALSALSRNRFTAVMEAGGKKITLRFAGFIPQAEKMLVDDPAGEPMVALSVTTGRNGERMFLKEGESADLDGLTLVFGPDPGVRSPHIRILREEARLALVSDLPLTLTSMRDRAQREVAPGEPVEFMPMLLYGAKGVQLVNLGFKVSGRIEAAKPERKSGERPDEEAPDALLLTVESNGESGNVTLFGGAGLEAEKKTVVLGEVRLELAYGSRTVQLPFSLKCADFEIGRYPGSMKPSSFASEVVILDPEKELEKPYRIYMNHILKYRGYRFFQSSYDEDEMGTILQVTRDPGTPVTYAGFFLLCACLVAHLFMPQSRFRKLGKKISAAATVGLLILAVSGALPGGARAGMAGAEVRQVTVQDLKNIPGRHVSRFSALLVQDAQGRIKPVHSLGRESLGTVTGGWKPGGLSPERVMLGMFVSPEAWKSVPVIRVKDSMLKRTLGMGAGESRASCEQFFDLNEGSYRLESAVRAARQKPAGLRNTLEEEALELDEALSGLDALLTGKPFRFFPKPEDPSNRWYSPGEIVQEPQAGGLMARMMMIPTFPEKEKTAVLALVESYRSALAEGLAGGGWEEADRALSEIAVYQKTNGSEVVPPDASVRTEILYNRLNLFQNLAWLFLLAGIGALVYGIVRMRKGATEKDRIGDTLFILLLLGFTLYSAGLAMRWIAAGHAPWSNKYESMIFIGWAVVLAGVVFSRRTLFALASSSLLASLILLTSHMGWTDPKITTLPPVLKSYWLVVHVSVITSSYGFFGMAALGGFLSLVLLLFYRGKDKHYGPSLLRLSWINERALLVGLVLVNVGNVFGAVWANESWGRYWGWDPKETWTLVIILVYTAVLHLRLIPAFRRMYFYALSSGAVIAFGSVMMTYFGVNFYLSGLHSYAAGDPVPVPAWVYVTTAVIALVIAAAHPKRKLLTGEN